MGAEKSSSRWGLILKLPLGLLNFLHAPGILLSTLQHHLMKLSHPSYETGTIIPLSGYTTHLFYMLSIFFPFTDLNLSIIFILNSLSIGDSKIWVITQSGSDACFVFKLCF